MCTYGTYNSMIQVAVIGFMALMAAEAASIKNLANVECGRVLVKRVSKIVGGRESFHGEFPWMVSIKSEDGQHKCGGFIVGNRTVLSAGHCFLESIFDPEEHLKIKVVAGEHNLGANTSPHVEEFTVETLKIHPNFTYIGYVNDIAILKLHRNFIWSPFVQPICLPDEDFDNGLSDVHKKSLVVAGYGKISEDQRYEDWKKNPSLRKVEIPLWDSSLCQEVYLKDSTRFEVRNTHICAGLGERDTCHGDSGSPLMTFKSLQEKQWVALGIVSTGKGCASGLPGIFTRSSKMIRWIEETISW